jgi:hypothetical protein
LIPEGDSSSEEDLPSSSIVNLGKRKAKAFRSQIKPEELYPKR